MTDAFGETQELVRRGREGDREALEDSFSRHRERLARMVRLRLDWRLRSADRPAALKRIQKVLASMPEGPGETWLGPKNALTEEPGS